MLHSNSSSAVKSLVSARKKRRKSKRSRFVAPEVVEQRILMSAVNGMYADQDSLEQAISQELEELTDQIANSVADAAASLHDVPLSAAELGSVIQGFVDETFNFDSSREMFSGVEIATWQDWNAGLSGDLVVFDFDQTFELTSGILSAAGSIGTDGGIQLTTSGQLSVLGTLQVDATFGLNSAGQLFIVEGSEFQFDFNTGNEDFVSGSLSVPGLGDVAATVTGADGNALLAVETGLLVTDNDQFGGERFTAAEFLNIAADARSYELGATFTAEASLSVKSPVDFLPDYVREPAIAAGITQSLEWNASLTADLVSGELNYNVDGDSIAAIDRLFSDHGAFEEHLFDHMLAEFREHNPIPESAQKFLATDIPLIESNVMDLLEIPEAAQYLIAPAAFDGPQVDSAARDYLDVDVSFFELQNLTRFLSGQDYDIISLSIDERFDQHLATVTVLPETVVFSYFGLANATVELQVTPGFFIDLDMTMGLDSKGLYLEGATETQAVDPHVAFGGSVTLTGVAEADVLLLVDFARITIDAEVEGFGNVTLVSPHTSPRMRVADLTAANMDVGLGVDLKLGMKGEVGLVAVERLDADKQVDKTFEIYRHGSETRLDSIEGEIDAFQDKLESKGKTHIYEMAFATRDPRFVTAAAVLLYHDHGRDLFRTATALVRDVGVELSPAFQAMSSDEFGMSIVDFAKVLRTEVNTGLAKIASFLQAELNSVGRVAEILGQDLGAGLYDTAKALINGADASVNSMVKALQSQLGASEKQIAEILVRLGENIGDNLIPFLNSAADALAAEVLKQLPLEKIADVVGDLQKGLTKGLPSLIGENNMAHILKIMDPAKVNMIAGRLTYRKTAELLAKLDGNSLARVGKALGDYQAAKILRSLPEAKMGDFLRDVRNGVLKQIMDKVDLETLRKAAGKLADSARSYIANRLPHRSAVREFVRGLSGGHALDTLAKLKNFDYQVDAIKHWVSMDVANHLFRKMDSGMFYAIAGRFSAHDIAKFAGNATLVRGALKNLFAHANPQTAGEALSRLAGSRFDAVVRSMPVSDIRRILPSVSDGSLDRLFRNLTSKKVGETLNSVSRGLRRRVFQTVSSGTLKNSSQHWSSVTRGIQRRLQRRGRSLLRW